MGRHFRRADSADQGFLLPPDARAWLPTRHLAWALLELAAELDLAGFEARYRADGQGSRPYHPAMMVTLVMYCYCKGIRSSRGIELATFDDVGARVICANLHPDHATIARFAGRHEQELKGLLAGSVTACAREGLVSVDVVAGDGTKVKASASMAANRTAAELDAEIAALEEVIAAEVALWVEQHLAADAADAAAGGAARSRPVPGRAVSAGRGASGQRIPWRAAGRRKSGWTPMRRSGRSRLGASCGPRPVTWPDGPRLRRPKPAGCSRWRPRRRRRTRCGRRRARQARSPAARRAAPRKTTGTCGGCRRCRPAGEKEAAAGPMGAAGPGKELKVDSPTRAAGNAMKKGRFDQLYNAQVIACKEEVLAIGTHDNPGDTGALHPLLAGPRRAGPAGITGPVRKALSDSGTPATPTSPLNARPALRRHHPRVPADRPRHGDTPGQDDGIVAADGRPAGHPRGQGPV